MSSAGTLVGGLEGAFGSGCKVTELFEDSGCAGGVRRRQLAAAARPRGREAPGFG